jgi:hypothetical protein
MDFEIEVGNRWKDEAELARRIARVVVSYGDAGCVRKDNGSWRLDGGNDWFMSPIQDGKVRVSYRYGHGRLAHMESLRAVLQWLVGAHAPSKPEPVIAWTDYPFPQLGDVALSKAPIRQVEVLRYDGDKYCDVRVAGVQASVKAGYLYSRPGWSGEVPPLPQEVLAKLER